MQTLSDKELAAYLKGRRDEQKAIIKELDNIRRLGLIELTQCKLILDNMSVIDQRPA
jgi:hypothetical protein